MSFISSSDVYWNWQSCSFEGFTILNLSWHFFLTLANFFNFAGKFIEGIHNLEMCQQIGINFFESSCTFQLRYALFFMSDHNRLQKAISCSKNNLSFYPNDFFQTFSAFLLRELAALQVESNHSKFGPSPINLCMLVRYGRNIIIASLNVFTKIRAVNRILNLWLSCSWGYEMNINGNPLKFKVNNKRETCVITCGKIIRKR